MPLDISVLFGIIRAPAGKSRGVSIQPLLPGVKQKLPSAERALVILEQRINSIEKALAYLSRQQTERLPVLDPDGKEIAWMGSKGVHQGAAFDEVYIGAGSVADPDSAPIKVAADGALTIELDTDLDINGDATISFDADSSGSGIAGSAGASAGYLTVKHQGTSYKFQILAVS